MTSNNKLNAKQNYNIQPAAPLPTTDNTRSSSIKHKKEKKPTTAVANSDSLKRYADIFT